MKLSQTFSILMWDNKAKADANGCLPLYARVTVDGKRAEISLKKKIKPEKWNAKAGAMKGSFQEARVLNAYINQVKNELFKLYHELQLNGEYITAETIKLKYSNPRELRKTLLDIFDFHNEQLEKLIGVDVVKATHSKFKTVRKKTADFIRYHYQKQDIFLDELSHSFLTEFEFFLKTHEKIDHNTTMRYIRNVKKIIHLSLTHGWLSNNPFQSYKCSLRKVERHILTGEEVKRLAGKVFTGGATFEWTGN